jgi:hypothetical protein
MLGCDPKCLYHAATAKKCPERLDSLVIDMKVIVNNLGASSEALKKI